MKELRNLNRQLNHHAAVLLPYYLAEEQVHFVLEQKDPNFRKPYFDGALNIIGGNWNKGLNPEQSPLETMMREVNEEFWRAYEGPESLNTILGQKFVEDEKTKPLLAAYDHSKVRQIQQIGAMLLDGAKYGADFYVTALPPLMKTPLEYGLTVFTKELSGEEYEFIAETIKQLKNKVRTDDLKRDGSTVITNLARINADNPKFAWGYDQVLSYLLENGIVPCNKAEEPRSVLRRMGLIQIEPCLGLTWERSYEALERTGREYKINEPKK